MNELLIIQKLILTDGDNFLEMLASYDNNLFDYVLDSLQALNDDGEITDEELEYLDFLEAQE